LPFLQELDDDSITLFVLVDADVIHGWGRWHHDLFQVQAMALLPRGRKQTSSATHYGPRSSLSGPPGGSRCTGSCFLYLFL